MKVIKLVDLAADKCSHMHRSFSEITHYPARIILALFAGLMLAEAARIRATCMETPFTCFATRTRECRF